MDTNALSFAKYSRFGKKAEGPSGHGGPRQVGKTTAARQIAEQWDGDVVFAAADGLLPHGPEWIHIQWNLALSKCSPRTRTLLVLDEVQKVAVLERDGESPVGPGTI
jgi:hypothetical protein